MILALLACAAPEVGLIRGDTPLWDPDALPVFRVTFEEADWSDMLWSNVDVEDECLERPYTGATVHFENPATGETEEYLDVGVRLRGNASLKAAARGEELPGYKLSFSEFVEDRRFHDVKKLNLLGTEGDFTFLREHFALQLARDAGLAAPYNAHALLYVNDEFQGVFPYTEEPDDGAYTDAHFPLTDGHLYKARGYCGNGYASLEYRGDAVEDYVTIYEPKAGTDDEDVLDDLVPMLICASETGDEAFVDCIRDWVDVDAFLALIALDALLPDVDGMAGRAHNFVLFFDEATERFTVYPWDKDQSFYTHDLADGSTLFDFAFVRDDEVRPVLVDRLVRLFPSEYCAALRDAATRADPAVFTALVEARGQFLWDPVDADPRLDLTDWKYGVQALIDAHYDRWIRADVEIREACGI